MEPSSMTSDALALPPITHSGVPPQQAPPLTVESPKLPDPACLSLCPRMYHPPTLSKLILAAVLLAAAEKSGAIRPSHVQIATRPTYNVYFPAPVELQESQGFSRKLDIETNLSSEQGETKASKLPAHQVDTDLLKHSDPRNLAQHEVQQEFGRLVIGDGKSRYVSNRFWARLGDEVEEMRDILGVSSDEEEEYSSPESHGLPPSHSQNHDGFLFDFSSPVQSLRELHPNADHMLMLMDIYLDN
ncbi:hypothetical protein ACJ72_01924, partial [Emergomyces africanus]